MNNPTDQPELSPLLWVLPFTTEPVDDSQGVWGRQLSSLIADALTESGMEAAWAPMIARTEHGPAWLQEEEPRSEAIVAEHLAGTPALRAVDGGIIVRKHACRAALRVVSVPDRSIIAGPWMLEADSPFTLLDRILAELGPALGLRQPAAPALLRQTSHAGALEAYLADRDQEALRSLTRPAGAAPEPGAAHRWRFLRRAARLDPGFVHAQGTYVRRAIEHARSGAAEDAAEAMRTLEDAVGPSVDLDGAQAEMWVVAKEWDRAEQSLRRGIERDDTWAYGPHRLGHLRLIAEDFTDAKQWLQRAHELDRDNPWTRTWLAVALDELGEHEEADGHWAAVLAMPAAPPRVVELATTTRAVAHARRS
ncbi:MAG: hypothetical protein EA398_15015 [Deltaproteobacteria bacterium]|nr:MAG: hypothetical protein EA398_15015 [Deltaproteobacteria bacterium]